MNYRKQQHGVTFIELVMSIVVISIGVLGILQVMNMTSAHSADPMIQHQAAAIAKSYLAEIETKSYTVQPQTGTRADFDDVDDYNGLNDSGAHDQQGNAIAGLGGYNVTVSIVATTLNAVPAKRIDVTVTYGNIVNLTISGYRTKY